MPADRISGKWVLRVMIPFALSVFGLVGYLNYRLNHASVFDWVCIREKDRRGGGRGFVS
jgi:hypothetical protein